MNFDSALFQSIYGLARQSSALDILGIFLAKYLGYFLMVGFLIALIFERNWKSRFYNFSLAALSAILARGIFTELIRFLYFRPRPGLVLTIEPLIEATSAAGLPSGHAAVFFALGTAVFYLSRKWGIIFLIGATLISLARVYVGVHWPLDILAGAIVGLASAFLVKLFLPKPQT